VPSGLVIEVLQLEMDFEGDGKDKQVNIIMFCANLRAIMWALSGTIKKITLNDKLKPFKDLFDRCLL